MEWSREQREGHEQNAEKFREAYIKGENKTASLEAITSCRRRCVTLIEPASVMAGVCRVGERLEREIMRAGSLSSYCQEIPHFTIDCHIYLTEDKLPENINQMPLDEQRNRVITPDEFVAYDKVLREEIGKEPSFLVKVKGIVFGGDGLVAQVWYDDKRMIDFTTRLGERVRREVPSIDYQWGMVKGKVPLRVVNLTRFTGSENREKVIKYVDESRGADLERFRMILASLYFSDHYVQGKNNLVLGSYNFSK